jgi:hypothetical protein
MAASSYFYRSARCACGFTMTVAGYSLARVQFKLDKACRRCGGPMLTCETPEKVRERFVVETNNPPGLARSGIEGSHTSAKNRAERRGVVVMELFDEDYLSMCD